MGDLSNKFRGRAFKELVALTLQAQGLDDAHVPTVPARVLSEGLDGPLEADIEGLPSSWWVETSAGIRDTLSARLDAAEQSAALAGRKHAAVVQYRQAHGHHRATVDSFVVMRLETFADILKRDAELEQVTR